MPGRHKIYLSGMVGGYTRGPIEAVVTSGSDILSPPQAVLLAAPGIEIIAMPQMRDNGLEEIKIK